MQLSLLILGSPYSNQSVSTALRFARACIDEGHTLYRIFFYHDGVLSGSDLSTPPQDEENIPAAWQDIATQSGAEIIVCIASALKRGILDSTEAHRYEKPSHNLAAGFEISGLGQLVDAAVHSDRVVTFGR